MARQYDWEAIEREYRAGQLSIREIARQHDCSDGAIRKRAKKCGWEQDLSKKVAEKVRNELVRSSVRTNNAETDKEIIDAAAATAVELVRSHRRDISKLSALEQKLIDELGDEENPPTKLYIAQYQGKTVEKVVGITVTERASALQALAGVQHKRIQLERQAFNLDDAGGGERSHEDALKDLE